MGISVASAKEAKQNIYHLPSPRKLALSIAVAWVTLACLPAHSAGLGRLTVQSALGQPLRAEVEVTSLSGDEAATLAVKLASPEAFRQAGLEYSPALAGLRFAVDKRPDGRAVVRITSAQPLNEPFVDLLVELNWATGKFVREYTFLLDPPELKLSREGGQEAPRAAAPLIAPATTEPAVAPAPRTPAAEPAPRPAPAQRAVRQRPEPASATPAGSGASGDLTVKPGDTLAQIAARVKPQNVSLDQAIVAIYRANPRAFFGSVHQLRAGATLSLPDEQAMTGVDAVEARTQIRAQSKDFAAYKQRLAGATRAVAGARAGQSATGSVSASVEDKGQPAAQGDQLKLSRSAPSERGGMAAGAPGARAGASERRVATEAAVKEAQNRVAELERNVADLQRLLELKNKQLADLQGAAAAGKQAPVVSGAVSPAPSAKLDAPKPVETPKAVEPTPAAPAPKADAPAVAGMTGASGMAGTAPTVPASEPPKPEAPKADGPTAAAPIQAPKPTEAPAPAPEPETSLIDEVLDNPLVLPGLGAVLALGAGYAWYAMRRRKKDEKFEDSLIAAEGFTANSLFGSTGGQTSVDTHSSTFATHRDTGADVHSTEVDPIAEAEVYIAYGREAQAEEILKEALKKQPDRQAIRLKLLEIHSGRKDSKAFAAVASEMYTMTGGQNEEWPKVVTLGLSVDPDNPLYTGRAAGDAQTFGVAGADAAATGNSAAASNSAAARQAPGVIAGLAAGVAARAGMAVMAAPEPKTESPVATAQAMPGEVPALNFDLELGDVNAQPAVSFDLGRGASDLSKAVEGKFDLPSLDLPSIGGSPAAGFGASTDTGHTVAFDGGDLKIDLPALEGLESASSDSPPAIDLATIGLDLKPAGGSPAATIDGARWQEMATKLDLASAYEEIGDKEGARVLLQEVVKGGDSDQQQRARSMLSKMS